MEEALVEANSQDLINELYFEGGEGFLATNPEYDS